MLLLAIIRKQVHCRVPILTIIQCRSELKKRGDIVVPSVNGRLGINRTEFVTVFSGCYIYYGLAFKTKLIFIRLIEDDSCSIPGKGKHCSTRIFMLETISELSLCLVQI